MIVARVEYKGLRITNVNFIIQECREIIEENTTTTTRSLNRRNAGHNATQLGVSLQRLARSGRVTGKTFTTKTGTPRIIDLRT